MRRNTVTLLKYLVGSVLLIFCVFLLQGVHRKWQRLGRIMKAEPDKDGIKQKQAKIDWHDYKAIAAEKRRKGPGEHGVAYRLPLADKERRIKLSSANGFNALVSDKISLERSVKDIRHKDCLKQTYLKHLPSASFILSFRNEHLSVLLRSVHSIVNRAPKELIKEIILADDNSDAESVKKPLDDYIKEHFTNVVVIRAKKREGLMRIRMMGARRATGDVLVFLDSHIECNINFLPPLLEPIAEDHRTVVCPFIDIIDHTNFMYRAQDEGARGAFNWQFLYKRLPLLEKDKKHSARPFANPVMAGGLFAVSKDWFWELGGYDPGLDIWGGEQYELSFKNNRRVAEVWMDEYAEYLYKRNPHYRSVDPGNLTEQKKLRKKLKCKPFKWFMEEVAFDLPKVYPPVVPPPLAEGEIRNKASNLCVETMFKEPKPRPCNKDSGNNSGDQELIFTWHKDIRGKGSDMCLDVSKMLLAKSPVALFHCHGMHGNQRFKYNLSTLQLYHPVSNQCMDRDAFTIFMNPCNASTSQKWIFGAVDEELVRKDFKDNT